MKLLLVFSKEYGSLKVASQMRPKNIPVLRSLLVRGWPWMASLLLHSLFISGAAHFIFPHLPEQEKTLEITWVEPRLASPAPPPERKTRTEHIIAVAKFPRVKLPEAVAPETMVPSLKDVPPTPKMGTIFLLDASESMVIGLDSAKQILKDRLNSLSEKIPVNIAYFSKEVIFFSPGILGLAKEEREKALAFCQKVKAQGNLEIADGLREVLKGNPSRIILISDGLVENREPAYDIISKARREGVIIDTILIKRNPFEDEVLKRAAYLTGGSFSISSQTF